MKGRLSFSAAKEIAITGYLSSLGIEPVKTRGNDYWYYSPFRNEKTPSFKVNVRKNVWFDHGSGEGGTILDLGTRLHNCSLPDFLNKHPEFTPQERRMMKGWDFKKYLQEKRKIKDGQ